MKFLLSRFVWDNKEELLYKTLEDKQLLCIPRVHELTLNRIMEAHDIPLGGHFGRDKTLANLYSKKLFLAGNGQRRRGLRKVMYKLPSE